MTAVVQAKCPRCSKLLRIPADWVDQAMRCKHCGQVIQARRTSGAIRPAAPPPLPAAAQIRTPLPKQNPPPPPAAVRAQTPAPVVLQPTPAPTPTAPLAPLAAPLAIPVAPTATAAPTAPMAILVAPPAPAAPAADSIFGDLDTPNSAGASPSRRRRRRSRLTAPLILLVLLGGVAVGGYFAWPSISAALKDDKEGVAQNTGREQSDTHKPTRPDPIKPNPGKKPDAGKQPDPGKKPDNPRPDPGKKLDPTKPEPVAGAGQYPRRALLISVHNYLFANPTHAGLPGASSRNITNMQRALTNGMRIPANQILHVSDVAPGDKVRPPLKSVIQEAVTSFLGGSRAQDRLLVFFIGRGVEIGDEAFLVPIEGELDNPQSLIPLKWFYQELEKCKAKQKVFVVDVARFSPTDGLERPDGGPLGAKFEAALKNPPPGVQVWSASSAGQQSYETDDSPMGVFLDVLWDTVAPRDPKKGFQGKIQRPADPFPLENLLDLVNKQMATELKGYKLQQVSFLSGKERDNGVAYDPREALAAAPTLPAPPDTAVNKASLQVVKGVLDEVGVPAIKASRENHDLNFAMLPPFNPKTLEEYGAKDAPEDAKLRKAIMKARSMVWAVDPNGKEPTSLTTEVKKIKADLRVNLSVMKDGYRKPANEQQFKNAVFDDERKVAVILGGLSEALEELQAASEEKEKESKRWQANYDFILARLQAEIAHLYEYQSMLGQIRKEFPALDPALHGGWRLASQEKLSGDPTGKRLAKNSLKLLDKIIKEHAGTPWEVLAKRQKLTALGLEWKPTR